MFYVFLVQCNKEVNFSNHKERVIFKFEVYLLHSQGPCASHTKMRKTGTQSQASQSH